MKRKGFTLIELLATIVILSVISLITIPIIMGVIDNVRRNGFQITCNEIYETYEQYEIGEAIIGNTNACSIFEFDSEREETEIIEGIKYEPIKKLSLKGELPQNGTYTICEGKRKLIIDNGRYTCIKDETRNEVLDGNIADNDITNPVIRDISLSSTTKSIRVVVDAIEEDGIITKYYYKINGEEVESESNIKVYEGLDKNTEYEIEVVVENKSGLRSNTVVKKIKTKEINNPTYVVSQSPEGTEYATSKKVTIEYDSQSGLRKYFKSDVEVEVVSGTVIGTCGTGVEPGECIESNATVIEANTWYEASGITPSITYKTTGTLYSLTTDEVNRTETSTYTVSKIDTSKPEVGINIGGVKTDRATVTGVCSDKESGIILYEYSSDNGTTWINGGTTASYTFIGLNKETKYTYRVRCTNGAGITEEASGEASTLGITNPVIAQKSETVASGYTWATERVIGITYTSTNIVSPKYYFKSSVGATVSSGTVIGTCGTGTVPGDCTASSVTTLVANTWYQTNSTNPSVTYKANGTLYALTSDEKNISGTSSYTISKVDINAPAHTNWWWGEVNKDVARLYVQTTDNVGISRVQCPTSTASGGYGNWNWFEGVWDGGANAYRCDITPGTFGHYGQNYETHLYIYDYAGNGGYYNKTSVAIPSANKTILPGTQASVRIRATGAGNVWSNTTNFGRSNNTGNTCMAAHSIYLGDVTNYRRCKFTISISSFTESDWRGYGVQYSVGGMITFTGENNIGTKITSGGTFSIDISSMSGGQYLNVGSIFGNYTVSSVILEP